MTQTQPTGQAAAATPIPPDEIRAAVMQLYIQEQGWFWSRFSAFSAMNAGLFVIVTASQSNSVAQTVLVVGGVLLALLWAYIQGLSLWYVQRYKPVFHKMREDMGITHKVRWPIDRVPLSSTAAGTVVSVIVAVLWIVFASLTIGGRASEASTGSEPLDQAAEITTSTEESGPSMP